NLPVRSVARRREQPGRRTNRGEMNGLPAGLPAAAPPAIQATGHRTLNPARLDGGIRTPTQEASLSTHGLEKSFGGRKVVCGASIYVRRGEAVGLLGPNGAGKTTVFYMITGLIRA